MQVHLISLIVIREIDIIIFQAHVKIENYR